MKGLRQRFGEYFPFVLALVFVLSFGTSVINAATEHFDASWDFYCDFCGCDPLSHFILCSPGSSLGPYCWSHLPVLCTQWDIE